MRYAHITVKVVSCVAAGVVGGRRQCYGEAGPGGMPDLIDSARGDGPNGCGFPPGPHHS